MSRELAVRGWPELGTLRVTGPDAKSWLNGLVTCDVTALSATQAGWGLALNRKGKIQTELWILQAGEQLLLSVSPGVGESVAAELERMLIMEDADLSNETGSYRWFSLHGSGAAVAAAGAAATASGWSSAIEFTAEEAAVLCVPDSQYSVAAGMFSVIGDAEWASLRLELDLPTLGVDYSSADRPHEAGLERRAISWTKGCYLGQEVVCMQDMRGKVKRSVRRLEITGGVAPELLVGKTVFRADKEIGQITSAALAPQGDGCWCFASLLLAPLDGPLAIADTPGQVTLVE